MNTVVIASTEADAQASDCNPPRLKLDETQRERAW